MERTTVALILILLTLCITLLADSDWTTEGTFHKGPATLQAALTRTGNGSVLTTGGAIKQLEFYTTFSTNTTAGVITFEASDDPTFTGTWASLGTATWAVANSKLRTVVSSPAQYVRARVSTTVTTSAVKTITAATKANPCKVTAVGHGYSTGNIVTIVGVVGMTQLNNKSYTITKVDNDNFTLDGVDSTAYTTYDSAGSVDLQGGVTVVVYGTN